jgi:hypothetical protein
MTMRIVLLLAAALLAAGCGGDDDQDALEGATTALTDTEGAEETIEEILTEAEEGLEEAEVTLDLEEQNGSGISGTVSLSPTSDGQLEVEIEVDGSDGGPHPAHIHEGSCADLNPEPAFPLEDVVDGRSETTVDVELTDLTLNEYAVNVHESPENSANYVACADVRNQ